MTPGALGLIPTGWAEASLVWGLCEAGGSKQCKWDASHLPDEPKSLTTLELTQEVDRAKQNIGVLCLSAGWHISTTVPFTTFCIPAAFVCSGAGGPPLVPFRVIVFFFKLSTSCVDCSIKDVLVDGIDWKYLQFYILR